LRGKKIFAISLLQKKIEGWPHKNRGLLPELSPLIVRQGVARLQN